MQLRNKGGGANAANKSDCQPVRSVAWISSTKEGSHNLSEEHLEWVGEGQRSRCGEGSFVHCGRQRQLQRHGTSDCSQELPRTSFAVQSERGSLTEMVLRCERLIPVQCSTRNIAFFQVCTNKIKYSRIALLSILFHLPVTTKAVDIAGFR
jgi:hypothetical protein